MIKISSDILRITSVTVILIAAVIILPAYIFAQNLTVDYSTYLGPVPKPGIFHHSLWGYKNPIHQLERNCLFRSRSDQFRMI